MFPPEDAVDGVVALVEFPAVPVASGVPSTIVIGAKNGVVVVGSGITSVSGAKKLTDVFDAADVADFVADDDIDEEEEEELQRSRT